MHARFVKSRITRALYALKYGNIFWPKWFYQNSFTIPFICLNLTFSSGRPSVFQSGAKHSGSPKKFSRNRRYVSFGPYVSPEIFDGALPPTTPLKRGATPTRSYSPSVSGKRKSLLKASNNSNSELVSSCDTNFQKYANPSVDTFDNQLISDGKTSSKTEESDSYKGKLSSKKTLRGNSTEPRKIIQMQRKRRSAGPTVLAYSSSIDTQPRILGNRRKSSCQDLKSKSPSFEGAQVIQGSENRSKSSCEGLKSKSPFFDGTPVIQNSRNKRKSSSQDLKSMSSSFESTPVIQSSGNKSKSSCEVLKSKSLSFEDTPVIQSSRNKRKSSCQDLKSKNSTFEGTPVLQSSGNKRKSSCQNLNSNSSSLNSPFFEGTLGIQNSGNKRKSSCQDLKSKNYSFEDTKVNQSSVQVLEAGDPFTFESSPEASPFKKQRMSLDVKIKLDSPTNAYTESRLCKTTPRRILKRELLTGSNNSERTSKSFSRKTNRVI